MTDRFWVHGRERLREAHGENVRTLEELKILAATTKRPEERAELLRRIVELKAEIAEAGDERILF